LSPEYVLKWLETPCVYNIRKDELYELDEAAFAFLKRAAGEHGCSAQGCDKEFLEYALSEGILTAGKVHGKRPLIKKSPGPSLRYLELQITTRCNLRCKHCYIGPPEDLELSLGELTPLLREFEERQGLRLLITGGEPLLHRQFREINDCLPDYAFRKVLLSNGVLFHRDLIKSLNVDEVQVSIDGLESGHDSLRGKGTFRKTLDSVRMLRDEGFEVSVATMVHSGDLDEFDEMEKLFQSIGIKHWSVDVPCVEGNLKDNPLFRVEPDVAGRYLRYGFGEGLHGGGEGFACGVHLASVTADGKVTKCAFYKYSPVGGVDEGLDVCWKRLTPVRLDDLECDCDIRELCRGGCRFRAELLGNPLGKDLYRCFAYGQKADSHSRDCRRIS
jgi:radical SAM protein with 4Fe4S-binding SPASM domain